MNNYRPFVIALIVIGIFISFFTFSGCNEESTSYSYDLKKISHDDGLYVTKTVYYNDRVEVHIKGKNISINTLRVSSSDYDITNVSTKYNTLIIYSNNPQAITSLDIIGEFGWYEWRFRYLNTNKYASIWRYRADDLPWSDYEGDIKAFYTQAEYYEQQNRIERTFEIAQLINENSNIDIELMGETGKSYEYCPNVIVDPNGNLAYAFEYPEYSGKYYWTQVYVECESSDLLGIHIGDKLSDIKRVMDEYGFEFSETIDEVYLREDSDHIDEYKNEDVNFSFYLNGDKLVYMSVIVFSHNPLISDYH